MAASRVGGELDAWQCGACTYLNMPTVGFCEMCGCEGSGGHAEVLDVDDEHGNVQQQHGLVQDGGLVDDTAHGGVEGMDQDVMMTAEVPSHAHRGRVTGRKRTSEDSIAEDARMAQMLQEEENRFAQSHMHSRGHGMPAAKAAASSASTGASVLPLKTRFPCMDCKREFNIGDLYSLDMCSHRFCRPCLSLYVFQQLQEHIPSDITCQVCHTTLSIRDVQDFSRAQQGSQLTSSAHIQASASASKRLMKELKALKQLTESAPSSAHTPARGGCGILSVELVDSNLYEWEVCFGNFDPEDPAEAGLAEDLRRVPPHHIVLRVVFPPAYPVLPPYVRVLRPRFVFRTGHVTVGGSICTEALTSRGWDAGMTMESVLLCIRVNMVLGAARIDKAARTDYTAAEAKEAFDRMVRTHGWY